MKTIFSCFYKFNRLIVIAFCFFCLNTASQELFYEHITTDNGLPTEVIYDAYTDSNGFLWFTTDLGLMRYNGSQFVTYSKSNHLSASGSLITEDDKGRIWYLTFDGFFYFVENNQLKGLNIEPSSFKNFVIKDDFLYRINNTGLEKINIKSLEKVEIYNHGQLNYCLAYNDFIVFGNKTLFKYHFNNGKIEKFVELPNEIITPLIYFNSEKILIIDKSKPEYPALLISLNGQIKKGELKFNEVLQNIKIVDNNIWAFTTNGIYQFDLNFKLKTNQVLFNKMNVSSFAFDMNRSYWFGAPNNGLFVLKQLDSKAFYSKDIIFSTLSKFNNDLFVGTTNGQVFQFDNKLNKKLYFDTKQNNNILFCDFNNHNQFNFFTGNGFYIIKKKTAYINRSFASVKDMAFVDDSTAYIAATGFVTKLNPYKTIDSKKLFEHAFLTDIRARSVAYDSKKNIYTATNKGLFKWSDNKLSKIKKNQKDVFLRKIRASNDSLFCLGFDGKIYLLHKNKWHKTEHVGIFENIKTIENNIYFQTKHAIYTFNNNRFFKKLDLSKFHQILDFEIVENNFFILLKNKIVKTPIHFQNEIIKTPKIFIDRVKSKNKTIHSSNNIINLTYQENNIQIEFSVLNFDYKNDYKLVYKINENLYELNWIQDKIYLANLPTGNNKIQLQIIDNLSKTSVFKSEILTVKIKPPLWTSKWFFVLMFSILFTIVYFSYQKKIKKIQKKNQLLIDKLHLESQLKDSKLQLIKSQMNPHFFFNAISNIQSYIFTKETKEASLYLNKFSKLTRKILEQSDVEKIALADEIDTLKLYLDLQKMRFQDLNYDIQILNIDNFSEIWIPTMLFQPYVENAILHGLAHSNFVKQLNISFEFISPSLLVCKVQDNGIGREKSQKLNTINIHKPKSFATKANLERIKILNKNHFNISVVYKDLFDKNNQPAGTLVTISIGI